VGDLERFLICVHRGWAVRVRDGNSEWLLENVPGTCRPVGGSGLIYPGERTSPLQTCQPELSPPCHQKRTERQADAMDKWR
jgi:hypothetical protein